MRTSVESTTDLVGISDVCINYRDGHVLTMYAWSSHKKRHAYHLHLTEPQIVCFVLYYSTYEPLDH